MAGNTSGDGGGIYFRSFWMTLSNNVISNNLAGNNSESRGGGVCCDQNTGGNISNNTISGNIAATNTRGKGGGIYIESSCNDIDVKSNLIKSNIAVTAGYDGNNESAGGGIYTASTTDMYNNLLVGNIASTSTANGQSGAGGGVFIYCQTCTVYNNTFYANANITSANGTGEGSGICPSSSDLRNNLFVNHNVANSDGVAIMGSNQVFNNGFNNNINNMTSFWCTNCVNGDPMFTDAANDDFSLLPSSVFINEGYPATDITAFPLDYAGNPRIHYGIIDIGAYEYLGPLIDQQPQNITVCAADTLSFSITAQGATSYQWQVNAGSGFTNISNGGVYSNATAISLTISGALHSMDNYGYRCVATNGFGSDTSDVATLYVNPTYYLTKADVICSGDSYTFPDGTTQTNITAQVVYVSYLQTALGCDSIIETTVDVNPVYNIFENVSVCSGDDYTFPDGTIQTNIMATMIHTSNLLTALGCDSIIETTVNINPVYFIPENDTICSGDDYTFPDGTTITNITAQVIHTSYLLTAMGCDSIIETTVDVHIVDVSVTASWDTLTANAMGATYQ